ncbi:MAG TPA: hypothetical protein PKC25_13865, partial [Candidatus Rifleibacterium sp.]|nr:hypothetical protein [Candidatus Rifleibacterium sp.]
MQRNIVKLLAVILLLLGCSSAVFAAARSVRPELQPGHSFINGQLFVMMADGPAYYCQPGQKTWQRIQQGQTLPDGYSVRTAAHGYLILSWGANNIILVKPESGLRVVVQPEAVVQLILQLHRAEVMVAARDSGLIEIEGRHGNLLVNHGDSSMI